MTYTLVLRATPFMSVKIIDGQRAFHHWRNANSIVGVGSSLVLGAGRSQCVPRGVTLSVVQLRGEDKVDTEEGLLVAADITSNPARHRNR